MSNPQKSNKFAVADPDTLSTFDEKMHGIEDKRLEELALENAKKLGVSYIKLFGFPIAPEVLGKIDEAVARKNRVVVFFHDGVDMRVASANPSTEGVMAITHTLEKSEGVKVKRYLVSDKSLDHALKLYAAVPKIKTVKTAVEVAGEEFQRIQDTIKTVDDIHNAMKGADVTHALAVLLSAAVNMDASDVHLEAEENRMVIRLRLDGILHEVGELPLENFQRIVARIKLLAGMKLNIQDVPQDGNITVKAGNEELNLRVSTLPTNYGESVVMRLLRGNAKMINLEELGLRPEALVKLNTEADRSTGMIIATGPTGSGKTTTLYALIKKMHTPENKIITLEDPIEYKIPGISQSEIHEQSVTTVDPQGQHHREESPHSYSFAKGLRSILRQDPDVIMVGEIRDLETAETAIQAALTGHVVLSTIHTNDASGTIPRFLAMGVKPFLLAPALNAIIGQRLVRKLCTQCKKETAPDAEQLARAKEALSALPENSEDRKKVDLGHLTFYASAGCEACGNLGYKGRVGIYEIFMINEEIEKIILSDEPSEYHIHSAAVKNGMVTMFQDGILKALEGLTSLDEVFRVAG